MRSEKITPNKNNKFAQVHFEVAIKKANDMLKTKIPSRKEEHQK